MVDGWTLSKSATFWTLKTSGRRRPGFSFMKFFWEPGEHACHVTSRQLGSSTVPAPSRCLKAEPPGVTLCPQED
jgi:hypothetical protein